MINYIEKQLPLSNKRRAEFISSIISENICKNKGYRILDVGCGTGELFTIPLAIRLRDLKNIKILGIDIHFPSIKRAKMHIDKLGLKNLSFESKEVHQIKGTYDCVCLMAVLEHLTNPEIMLGEIRKRVNQNGFFILYIPNGHGVYEIESAIFKKLRKSNLSVLARFVYKFLRKIKCSTYQKINIKQNAFIIKETLNDPNNIHIQFFKLKEVKKMLHKNGFLIKDIFKTRFIGGPFSNVFLHRFKILEDINHKIAYVIPVVIASDWTFICIPE